MALTLTKPADKTVATCHIALVGNPNSGKTTLFNALTGMRQRVANYPGVTVEKRTGRCTAHTGIWDINDLPGCYSLYPRSPDEEIVCNYLFGRSDEPAPDAIICLVSATNLDRHLYLAGQVIDLGIPVVIALTMSDEAEKLGIRIDRGALSQQLGVPVVNVVATSGIGLKELTDTVAKTVQSPAHRRARTFQLPPPLELRLKEFAPLAASTEAELLFCLCGQHTGSCNNKREDLAARIRSELNIDETTVRRFVAEGRYAWQGEVVRTVVRETGDTKSDWTRRIDSVLLHKLAGPLVLVGLLALVFQAVFAWAAPAMDFIAKITDVWLPSLASGLFAPGPLLSLINDGILAGVGAVVIFLPQILILFLFLTLLEDSGYMARAAFMLDRVMSKVGLSGRSFIPLLSSYACAIPGIMATRTIPNWSERLATILVAPLMTCSARLVVYTLLIAAFVPNRQIWGPFGLQGVALLGLYLLGILAAAGSALFFRRTILRGPTPPLLMELPPYRQPRLKTLLLTLYDRARVFLVNAGTIIFAVSIVLWVLLSFPKSDSVQQRFEAQRETAMAQLSGEALDKRLAELDNQEAGEMIRHSAAGYLGHAIEPIVAPLGFDWKIGIGILGSFAAREVFVSTMGVVYGVGSEADDRSLVARVRADRDPDTGQIIWTPLVAFTLLVFYAFALQCVSTVAVIKRETNTWRWPIFAFVFMTVMAYGAALLTRQIGHLIA